MDYYGNIVGSDSNSAVRIQIDGTFNNEDGTAKKYTPMIEGETNYIVNGGVTKVSGVKFTGTPGSTFKVSFEGTGIDNDLPVN